MATFNILHLSDFHFAAQPYTGNVLSQGWRRKVHSIFTQNAGRAPPAHNPHRADAIARLAFNRADRLQRAGDRLDVLIVSGDLATTGIDVDLKAAHDYLDAPPHSAWYRQPPPGDTHGPAHATLKNIAHNVFIVPGNHDRFKNVSCDAGGNLFDQIFKDYWNNVQYCVRGEVISKTDPKTGKIEQFALVGADFCLRNNSDALIPLLHKGRGCVYQDISDELERKTQALRGGAGMVSIWVTHFPPEGSIAWKEVLLDYHLVKQASLNSSVSLFLSGHIHKKDEFRSISGAPVWSAGSATQYSEPNNNWAHFIELEIDGGKLLKATRTNYAWNRARLKRRFEEDSIDRL